MHSVDDDGPIELEQDLSQERREWRIERLGWMVQLAIMAAALLGAFGDGPISGAVAGEQGSTPSVEYERFGRFGAPMRLVVHAPPDSDGRVRIALDEALVRAFRIIAVTPAPRATRVAPDAVQYEFDASGDGDAMVLLDVEPAARWRIEGTIRSGNSTLRISQFIYP